MLVASNTNRIAECFKHPRHRHGDLAQPRMGKFLPSDDRGAFYSSVAIDYPPTRDTVISALSEFCTAKSLSSSTAVSSVVNSMREQWSGTLSSLRGRSVVPGVVSKPNRLLSSPRTRVESIEMWLPWIFASATIGSSTGWWKRLGVPLGYFENNTKRDVVSYFSNRDSDPSRFYEFVDVIEKVYDWLSLTHLSDHSGRMVMYVEGKDEPVPAAKLMEGRHRSIQFPDWAVQVIMLYLSHFENLKEDVDVPLDQAVAMVGAFSTDPAGGWCVGHDLLTCVPRWISERTGNRASLDVSGWDRSLRKEFIVEVFEECIMLGRNESWMRTVAHNLAVGQCGGGVYEVHQELWELPPDTWAWGSGILFTLSGNSIIHSAILRSFLGHRHFLVQGDDALIVDVDNVGLDKLTSRYSAVGLSLKTSACMYGQISEFCKIVTDSDGSRMDSTNQFSKIQARAGHMGEGYILSVADSIASVVGRDAVESLPRDHPWYHVLRDALRVDN